MSAKSPDGSHRHKAKTSYPKALSLEIADLMGQGLWCLWASGDGRPCIMPLPQLGPDAMAIVVFRSLKAAQQYIADMGIARHGSFPIRHVELKDLAAWLSSNQSIARYLTWPRIRDNRYGDQTAAIKAVLEAFQDATEDR